MQQRSSNQKQRGFTLVEIAIVLMIIGLLIGGILRGQELITSARVRNIIDQKAAIQTAQIGFMDRYKMLPGDLTVDQANIVGMGAVAAGTNGGNGLINIAGDATNESVLVFQNLAASGFISCGPCMTVIAPAASTINNSPVNVYSDFLMTGRAGSNTGPSGAWWWDWRPAGTAGVRNLLTTGASIGSQILAETDRKADDGNPGTGSLRLNTAGGANAATQCAPVLATASTQAATAPAVWANPAWDNCAGAWLL
jgi:prepilin-type N-terminal cleavage/methylation domain-containing protein